MKYTSVFLVLCLFVAITSSSLETQGNGGNGGNHGHHGNGAVRALRDSLRKDLRELNHLVRKLNWNRRQFEKESAKKQNARHLKRRLKRAVRHLRKTIRHMDRKLRRTQRWENREKNKYNRARSRKHNLKK